jgi:hypothetical protein
MMIAAVSDAGGLTSRKFSLTPIPANISEAEHLRSEGLSLRSDDERNDDAICAGTPSPAALPSCSPQRRGPEGETRKGRVFFLEVWGTDV